MKRPYIAGPMSGHPEMNFPAFHAAAAQLRAKGFDAVNPAEVNVDPAKGWLECMKADIPHLLTCDALVMLPSWQLSRGARVEHSLATGLGLPTYTLVEAMAMDGPSE